MFESHMLMHLINFKDGKTYPESFFDVARWRKIRKFTHRVLFGVEGGECLFSVGNVLILGGDSAFQFLGGWNKILGIPMLSLERNRCTLNTRSSKRFFFNFEAGSWNQVTSKLRSPDMSSSSCTAISHWSPFSHAKSKLP